MKQKLNLNFDDPNQKRDFLRMAGAWRGRMVVEFKPDQPRRSNKQNARHWAAVVPAFQEYLRQQGESLSAEECHELLKARVLGTRQLIDKATGEVIGEVSKRSSTLDIGEFSEFTALAEAWLRDYFNIIIQDEVFA